MPRIAILHGACGASGGDVKLEPVVAVILHFVICGETRLYLAFLLTWGQRMSRGRVQRRATPVSSQSKAVQVGKLASSLAAGAGVKLVVGIVARNTASAQARTHGRGL